MNYVSYRGLFTDAALRPLAVHKRALGLFFLTLAMGGVALAFSLRFNFLGSEPSHRLFADAGADVYHLFVRAFYERRRAHRPSRNQARV